MGLKPRIQIGDEPSQLAGVGGALAHPCGRFLIAVAEQLLLQQCESLRPLSAPPTMPAWRETESQRVAGTPSYSSWSSEGKRASVRKSITDCRERSVFVQRQQRERLSPHRTLCDGRALVHVHGDLRPP